MGAVIVRECLSDESGTNAAIVALRVGNGAGVWLPTVCAHSCWLQICDFAANTSAASIPIHGLMLAFRLVSSGAALTMANVVLQSRQFAANRADAHGSEFAFS